MDVEFIILAAKTTVLWFLHFVIVQSIA